MKYAIIPILREIEAFGDTYTQQDNCHENLTGESVLRNNKKALELLLKLYEANKNKE